jgi:hypothetical protein
MILPVPSALDFLQDCLKPINNPYNPHIFPEFHINPKYKVAFIE